MAARKKARSRDTTGTAPNRFAKKLAGAQVTTGEMKRIAKEFKKLDARIEAESGPAVTKSGKPKGRNPHVGLRVPKLTAKEKAARKKARSKKGRGRVRAVNRRK
jgi:hypothetical protein